MPSFSYYFRIFYALSTLPIEISQMMLFFFFRFFIVYMIFLLHGIGVLLPWNVFINANNVSFLLVLGYWVSSWQNIILVWIFFFNYRSILYTRCIRLILKFGSDAYRIYSHISRIRTIRILYWIGNQVVGLYVHSAKWTQRQTLMPIFYPHIFMPIWPSHLYTVHIPCNWSW